MFVCVCRRVEKEKKFFLKKKSQRGIKPEERIQRVQIRGQQNCRTVEAHSGLANPT